MKNEDEFVKQFEAFIQKPGSCIFAKGTPDTNLWIVKGPERSCYAMVTSANNKVWLAPDLGSITEVVPMSIEDAIEMACEMVGIKVNNELI